MKFSLDYPEKGGRWQWFGVMVTELIDNRRQIARAEPILKSSETASCRVI